MKAAVVTAFDVPPRYLDFPDPVAHGEDQAVVDVLAAGLHPRVRSQADGSHCTGTGELPLVPGVDAVVRDPEGRIRYTVMDETTLGTMAERTVIEMKRSVVLPDQTDPVLVAAAMNPAMSSWVALRRRVPLQPGQSVLVLGATGNAGTMAVQIAKRLGAGRVIGAGRDPGRLHALLSLGADEVVPLTGDTEATAQALGAAAGETDVVIDYLWGRPAQQAVTALLTARSDRGRALDWIQIGAMAGPAIELPSAALRSANLRLQGSGQGSVPAAAYRAELPSLVHEIDAGTFAVRPTAMPLAEVEAIWTRPDPPGERTVLVP